MVRVRSYPSVKSLGSARAQAARLSWIVDVDIHIPWPHSVTRLNLDFSSLFSSARVDYSVVYCTRVTCSRFFNSICGYLCNTAILRYWYDVKWHLWHTSHDEWAQALCANFVLQATNAQGLGTRLGLCIYLHFYITPTLFAYCLACHPYIFLHLFNILFVWFMILAIGMSSEHTNCYYEVWHCVLPSLSEYSTQSCALSMTSTLISGLKEALLFPVSCKHAWSASL